MAVIIANIKFNGKSSLDFGLILQNTMEHSSPANDIETVDVPGRDGVLLIDNNRLMPIEQEFDFVLKPKPGKKVFQVAKEIAAWLRPKGFKDLELSWDSGYIYQATFLDGLNVEEVITSFGKLKITLLIQPIKYLKSEMQEKTVNNGGLLVNKGSIKAKPKIKITGSGAITLKINNRETKFKNVQGEIIFDAKNNMVYRGSFTSEWDKIVANAGRYQEPYLDPGNNTISWTGNVTKVTVVTNAAEVV